jgi:hypothetical protein
VTRVAARWDDGKTTSCRSDLLGRVLHQQAPDACSLCIRIDRDHPDLTRFLGACDLDRHESQHAVPGTGTFARRVASEGEMARAALRESSETHRTALRRFATAASIAILLLAIYEAWPRPASCPQPANPKPGVGWACDPTGPTYHPALWLVIAAMSVVALVAVRRLLSEEAS